MPISMVPSFLIYCYVGAITPGPANLCSLGAALRYGTGPALGQWRGLVTGIFLVSMAGGGATWVLGAAPKEDVGVVS